jgi:hypothetical protein
MYIFKLRRASSASWISENPILSDGEPGFELDTGRLKVGNGYTPWAQLNYFVPEEPTDPSNATLPEHVNSGLPHPVYDEGPSLVLLYENAKV